MITENIIKLINKNNILSLYQNNKLIAGIDREYNKSEEYHTDILDSDYLKSIESVYDAIDNDSINTMTRSVHVDKCYNLLTIKSIDGYKIFIRNLEHNQESNYSFAIDKDIFILAKKIFSIKKAPPTLYIYDDHIEIVNDDIVLCGLKNILTIKLYTDNFIPILGESNCTINRKKIMDTLKSIKKNKEIIFDIDNESHIRFKVGDHVLSTRFVPERVDIPFRIAVSPEYLYDALKSFDTDEISIYFTDSRSVLVLTSYNHMCAIMPKRVNYCDTCNTMYEYFGVGDHHTCSK